MKGIINNETGDYFAVLLEDKNSNHFPIPHGYWGAIEDNHLLGKIVDGGLRTVGGFDSGDHCFIPKFTITVYDFE